MNRVSGKRRGASRAKLASAVALVIAGLLVLSLPYALDASMSLSTRGERQLVGSARDLIARDGVREDDGGASGAAASAAALYEGVLPALRDYNESLLADGQAINDPFSDQAGAMMMAELAALDGLIGTVRVPAMGCELALYYGASYEHLAAGAAVVSGTSVPLGDPTSNCVIAGHRSLNGASVFRNIEDVRIGDELILETPWEVLRYRAVETRVISPSDSRAVAIQEGRDLVTLVTCHPYGYNHQRYVVYFERDKSGGEEPAPVPESPGWAPLVGVLDPGKSTFPEDALRLVGFALSLAAAVLLLLPTKRDRGRGRHSR